MQTAAMFCWLFALAMVSARGDLLRNGDFEVPGTDKDKVPGWNLSKEAMMQRVWIDARDARSGRGCLAIQSIRTTELPAVISQRVPVEPNSPYALSLWAKRDSFVYGTKFQVVLMKEGNAIGVQSKNFRGQDWFPVYLAFDSGEADAVDVQLITPNTGTWRITVGRTLWVDDVQLVKIDPKDNIVVEAEAAVRTRGCTDMEEPGALNSRCLAVSDDKQALLVFDMAPSKGGPYYVWVRARCPGQNGFSIRTAEGREWLFRSHTPTREWRWVRPILPELLLDGDKQPVELTAQGKDVAIDQVVLTMDPFWSPEGAPQLMTADEAITAQREKGFTPGPGGTIELSILGQGNEQPWTGTRWPVSQGLPFPRGILAEPDRICLRDETGTVMPCQTSVLTRWPDRSIKWLLISTFAPKTSHCRLEYGGEARLFNVSSRHLVTEGPDRIEVATGKLKVHIPKDGSALFSGIWVYRDGDHPAYEQVVAKTVLRANEKFLSSGPKPAIAIEERGPVRATIKISGQYAAEGISLLDYVLRIHAYDGADFLTMEHTFLRRDGDLRIPLDDMALVLDLTDRTPVDTFTWQGEDGPQSAGLSGQAATLVSKITSDPKKQNDYPFSVRISDKEVARGFRYAGLVRASGQGFTLGGCVRHFWQNSPKGFSVSPRRFEVGLIARGETIKFFKGMAKTHEIMLHFGSDPKPLACFAMKPLLVASPEWYCESQAFDALPAPRGDGKYAHYERCIDETLARWYERIGQTAFRPGCGGMIHIGDIGGGRKFMNLETALGEGFMVQFFRTGSRAAFDQADLSLNHFSDIDIDHSKDHGGLIYVHSAHGREVREDRKEGINGHSWFNGTTYYGLFTGSRRILEQAADVGNYYADCPFPLQPYIHYWRKIAWKLMDLMCAYDLTGDARFLEAARQDIIVTQHQRDHVVTLWPYMCGVGLKALRHYYDTTRDPEARELYLQMIDGFLHLRERRNDTVNGEHPKRPGMLFGNFPNDRSCAFYNELAHAYFMTGRSRYAEAGASDLNWQVRFNVNDPTLLWGSSDLVTAMRKLELSGPRVAQTLPGVFMTERAEPSLLLPPQINPTITFQVMEQTDQPFTIHLFKGCYRKYTIAYHGTASLYDPDGEVVAEQPVSTDGLQDFECAVPKDGKTGVYTLQVVLDDIWRWTVVDASFDLMPGKHVMRVSPRYTYLCFDQFLLSPDPACFPWLGQDVPADTIALEAESAPLTKGYEIADHPDASGGRYVRRDATRSKETMNYEFDVPGEAKAKGRYRLFCRIWKPRADLLNVWMDEQPVQLIQQVHDMDGNVYPVWSVGTSLGDAAVVRYWQDETPGRPTGYSAKYLKPTKLFDKE